MCTCFYFGRAQRHAGSQLPDQGSKPRPMQWKHGVLSNGLSWKSWHAHSCRRVCYGNPAQDVNFIQLGWESALTTSCLSWLPTGLEVACRCLCVSSTRTARSWPGKLLLNTGMNKPISDFALPFRGQTLQQAPQATFLLLHPYVTPPSPLLSSFLPLDFPRSFLPDGPCGSVAGRGTPSRARNWALV